MENTLLTAKEAIKLTSQKMDISLINIISVIRELALDGKFYAIFKDEEVSRDNVLYLKNILGYQVY